MYIQHTHGGTRASCRNTSKSLVVFIQWDWSQGQFCLDFDWHKFNGLLLVTDCKGNGEFVSLNGSYVRERFHIQMTYTFQL